LQNLKNNLIEEKKNSKDRGDPNMILSDISPYFSSLVIEEKDEREINLNLSNVISDDDN
jgi:hypothetical protein